MRVNFDTGGALSVAGLLEPRGTGQAAAALSRALRASQDAAPSVPLAAGAGAGVQPLGVQLSWAFRLSTAAQRLPRSDRAVLYRACYSGVVRSAGEQHAAGSPG